MGKKQQTVVVIETRDDADRALQRLGELARCIESMEQDAEDSINAIRQALVEESENARKALVLNEAALKAWAKRDVKTWAGKTLDLVFGSMSFRTPPPSIKLLLEAETIVERLRARRMTTCIRVKEEVDKEALENYSDEVIEAVGCERKQGKDKFYYECKAEEVK